MRRFWIDETPQRRQSCINLAGVGGEYSRPLRHFSSSHNNSPFSPPFPFLLATSERINSKCKWCCHLSAKKRPVFSRSPHGKSGVCKRMDKGSSSKGGGPIDNWQQLGPRERKLKKKSNIFIHPSFPFRLSFTLHTPSGESWKNGDGMRINLIISLCDFASVFFWSLVELNKRRESNSKLWDR